MVTLRRRKVIMKMRLKLLASWDQPTRCIFFHDVERTRLRVLAFQLTEKLLALVKRNERAVKARIGGGKYMSFPQGKQGRSGRIGYGACGARTVAFDQVAGGGYRSNQSREAGRYFRRIASSIKGS
ncbi:hypothetical protein SLEP1_g35281 [Rubroshorea leprosula]|uniref:Uncharacterized protein n=1 Tax=Rubroshorea leprosula TaxID=152421 RepID=A0AAV5KMN3_9ROSI|nr:hypothetical protein SLEP1_g35281 [Rubroshorea leprosula]